MMPLQFRQVCLQPELLLWQQQLEGPLEAGQLPERSADSNLHRRPFSSTKMNASIAVIQLGIWPGLYCFSYINIKLYFIVFKSLKSISFYLIDDFEWTVVGRGLILVKCRSADLSQDLLKRAA